MIIQFIEKDQFYHNETTHKFNSLSNNARLNLIGMVIMNDFTFALPRGYDWDVNKFTREVKTKAWVKKFQHKLGHWADKLTNANRDDAQIIGGLLQTAYGVNIGQQIEAKLKPNDFTKIRGNILSVMFY